MNYYHEKFKDDLVVIGICETDETALKEMKGPLKLDEINFHLAVDTNRRFADKLGVYGIPHAVILEPESGAVIWEGMPTLPGYELDEKTIEKILAVGKKRKEAGKVPEVSPVKISVKEADPEKTPKRQSGQASW
ncbi:MAG: TlpA family protein disulfide reductase [Thermoguttaceae bacterium]